MCGIAGIFDVERRLSPDRLRGSVEKMVATLVHRGPDDHGIWIDDAHGVGLGFRRLAILDLTAAGAQPMISPDRQMVVVSNGEIYNHLAIREELERAGHAPRWRGHSDTETLIAAAQAWGIRGALERCNGMLAAAIWDGSSGTLTLARDRIGKKPLYYGWAEGVLLFASELKALHGYPGFQPSIDPSAVAAFLRFGYVPAPHAIWRGVRKLPAASLLSISTGAGAAARPEPYWSVRDAARRGFSQRATDQAAYLAQLETLLRDAVSLRLLSDVPLGALLSGGIDSSLVTALMQAQSSRPVRTFSIGFDQPAFNEADRAAAVARHLGTDHTELYVTAEQARAVIPHLPVVYDEPFADSSQIPTWLVSELARRHVTVVLSGDGGDELFGGYTRYRRLARQWDRLSRVPSTMRSTAQRLLATAARHVGVAGAVSRGAGVSAAALAEALDGSEPFGLYRAMISRWAQPANLVVDGEEAASVFDAPVADLDGLEALRLGMVIDAQSYLPDDILVKVDRASMNVSLEARAPLLDYRVIECAWRQPASLLEASSDPAGKAAIKHVLYRYVPRALVDRPKMGFGVPIDDWLRGPLRTWAQDLLSEARLRRQGLLRPEPIHDRWRRHLRGETNAGEALWTVLMFQAWHDRWA